MFSRATLPIVGFLMLFGLAPVQPFGAITQPRPQAGEYLLQVNPMANDLWAAAGIKDDVVEVQVQDAGTGLDYGTCTLNVSGSTGGCTFSVEPNSTVIATLDEATLPTGVSVPRNPVFYNVPAGKTQPGDIVFALELVGDDAGTGGSASGSVVAWDAWLNAAERMVEGLRP
jgi:hypothetical protein